MPPRSRYGDILLKAGLLDAAQLASVLEQQEHWGGTLQRWVVERGLADEETLLTTLAQGLRVERAQMPKAKPERAVLSKVELSLAQKHSVFPLAFHEASRVLQVAMADPTNLSVLDTIAMKASVRVVAQLASEQEIEQAIQRHYLGQEPSQSEELTLPPDPGGSGPSSGRSVQEDDLPPELQAEFFQNSAAPLVSAPAAPAAQAPRSEDLLAELLSGGAPPSSTELTPEEQQRLSVLRENQAKSGRIVEALTQLLAEKGLRPLK